MSAVVTLYYIQFDQTDNSHKQGLFDRLHRFLSQPKIGAGDYYFLIFLSLWVLIITWAIHHWILGGIPHVYDEIAQLFQAKIFASGYLAMPAPIEPQFFERMYIPIEQGRWYAIYPPGHALILAIGVLAGYPQWINPILSALIVPLFFLGVRRFSSLYTARLGSLLFALSPFFLLMGSGYMNHPTCLFFLLLFLFLGAKIFENKQISYPLFSACLSGLCVGMAFLVRPLTALAFLFAGCAWIIVQYRGISRKILLSALVVGVSMLPCLFFFLTFNNATTGSPWITGYQHYFDANPMGFGDKPWGEHPLGPKIPRGEHHTLLRGIANTICNFNALNAYLFGWPVPSLLFAFFLFLPGLKRKTVDYFCLLLIAAVCGMYFFYFFQDDCYGPRFLYETIPCWILLSARGVQELSRWGDQAACQKNRLTYRWLYAFIFGYFILAMGTSWFERLAQYSDSYWGTRAELAQMLREGIPEKDAVILVEDPNDHLAVFSFLDPRLDRGWIVAHDLGDEENSLLLRHYPEWPVYRLRLKEDLMENEIKTVLEPFKRY